MEFLSPISTPTPLAPINDQNLKTGGPMFLFKLVLEICFSDALLVTEVISIRRIRRRLLYDLYMFKK